jgi:regulator of protease activity HflC (stomatin/prohibitin superfamily)
VKEIKLPPALQKSIESKLVEQQSSLAMEFRIARERLEAERKVIEAGGVEKFNRTVAPTLTSDLLRYRGIEATLKLAESTNAKVVVVGGAGTQGLPLILDTGGAAAPAPAPDPAPVPVPVPVPIPVPVPAAAPGPLPGLPLPGLTPGR